MLKPFCRSYERRGGAAKSVYAVGLSLRFKYPDEARQARLNASFDKQIADIEAAIARLS